MVIRGRFRAALKRVLFGPENFAQQCAVGSRDPQSEITVLLRGLDSPIDVTQRHLMACGFPFTVGIGLSSEKAAPLEAREAVTLEFVETASHRRLGKIDLRPSGAVDIGDDARLCLFHPRSYGNFCLPKPWLWARYLSYARFQSSPQTAEMPLTTLELRSMYVFYICPRPVVLATACDANGGNLFPLNLMGPVGAGHFAFALNSSRAVTSTVERAGRIVLSSIPVQEAATASQLGTNHRHEHVAWTSLPFRLRRSRMFGFPVPGFAMRVREMQVESAHEMGSHRLFVARTLDDERIAEGAEFFVVHGIYQAWKQRLRTRAEVKNSGPGGLRDRAPQSLVNTGSGGGPS